MELIIDVVSRGKKVLQRHHANGEKITIGRGYDNDVILTDPYVCANHLLLNVNEQGLWQVADCQSVNGSFDDSGKPLDHTVVHSGDVLEIGKTRLRFIYPNEPVAPTIRLGDVERFVNWLSSPMMLILLLIGFFALSFGNYYLNSSTQIKTTQMVASSLMQFIGLCLSPLFFGAVARMFKHDARLLTQLAISVVVICLSNVIDKLFAVISFNINQLWFTQLLGLSIQMLLTFGYLWLSLYVALHQNVLRRTLFAAGFTGAIFLFFAVYESTNDRDFNPRPVYDAIILAPEFVFSEAMSVDEFISQSESVFDKAREKVDEE